MCVSLGFCVAMATCGLVMATGAGSHPRVERSVFGHNEPHKKGKMCYQCAWSPPKMAFATIRPQYNAHLSMYGEPSHTRFYPGAKEIAVRVKGGWDKCYDRFTKKQADMFGIDQWECEHNCYTRIDKNGDLYRGCYKGEFNVNPNKLGCHMQAGSRYCFCGGELCNFEQGQGYDGSGKNLQNINVPNQRIVFYKKPRSYDNKPAYLQHYDPHVAAKHKKYVYDKYGKMDKYGYYVDYDTYRKHLHNFNKGTYKVSKKHGFDGKHSQEEKIYRYNGSIRDNGFSDKYASGDYEGKIHGYNYDKFLFDHKPQDTYAGGSDGFPYRKHGTLKHGYNEYDYGKLGYIIDNKSLWNYHGQAPSQHDHGTYRHNMHDDYAQSKRITNRRNPDHHMYGNHRHQSDSALWDDYNAGGYYNNNNNNKNYNNYHRFKPMKPYRLYRHDLKTFDLPKQMPVNNNPAANTNTGTDTVQFAHAHDSRDANSAQWTMPMYGPEPLLDSSTFDYAALDAPFDYKDAHRPPFNYEGLQQPAFTYNAIFGYRDADRSAPMFRVVRKTIGDERFRSEGRSLPTGVTYGGGDVLDDSSPSVHVGKDVATLPHRKVKDDKASRSRKGANEKLEHASGVTSPRFSDDR